MIGDPEQRYREDPVRMLRAVRLAAKLGGEIEPKTRAPIKQLAPLVQNVPTARVFEEMLKLLLSGHARECVMQAAHEGLHHGVLPMLDVILEQPLGERFVMLALEKTDQRVREDKPVSPGFLFAALLWHEVLAAWKAAEAEGLKPIPALHQAMDAGGRGASGEARHSAPLHRRHERDLGAAAALAQPLRTAVPIDLLEHPRFRAGFDFLLLRCDSGEVESEVGAVVGSLQGRRRRRARPHAGAGPRWRRSASAGDARAARPQGAVTVDPVS